MSFNTLLYHGHKARLIEVAPGAWQIVLPLDGNYSNYEQALEMLVYWQGRLALCHEIALITKDGRL